MWSQWPQNVPSTTKHSQIESQLPKVSSPTSSQSKMSQFPQSSKNNSSQKNRLLPSVLRLPSKTQNRLLPSTVVRAKPKKSRVASLGLETLFTNGQPFQFNSRVSRAEKIIRGCTTQVSIGVSSSSESVFRKQKFSCQSTSSWCGCNLVLRVVCA